MKSSVQSFLCATLAVLGAVGLHAQPAPKVVVLDLSKAYDSYWETSIQNTKLKDLQDEAQLEANTILKERNDLVVRFNDLRAKVNGDPTITQAAKTDAEKEGVALTNQIQKKGDELQQLSTTTSERLRAQFNTYKDITIPKITTAAKAIAKQKGANMLIDKSNNTAFATSTFLWFDESYPDITDEVIKSLNAGHATPPPAAAATTTLPPIKTATPETAAPSIVFPAKSP